MTDDVYQRLTLLARAWDLPPGEAVRRLIDTFHHAEERTAAAPTPEDRVSVHALYEGVRTDGLYEPLTQALTITTGPLAGRAFPKPSGAAVAIVAKYNPAVNPNRNGWSFWVVSETGERLQSFRNRR